MIEDWMEGTYTHPDLQKWLIIYLRKQNKRRFHDLEGLPESMRSIAEDQDRIGWASFCGRAGHEKNQGHANGTPVQ